MRTVYKYGFAIQDDVTLTLPRDAEILHVDAQGAVPCVWALVDTTADEVDRRFLLAGTGHPLPDDGLTHVGSFQMVGGALVFHLFEIVF